ncbi:MAG: adenosylmethionine--8-amino-7-oxononanoate transaminase, partial [Candidatus Omnitrophica bacterium]|nr:adenosylmethionine--8-amino-7-oxononanoate transaminase [Candidatus Omnitrophota bacterium]
KVFFSDNGSTAVEAALKMCFQYWQNIAKLKKTKFICLDYAYHGDTFGAMSVSGESLFNQVFSPLFFKTFRLPSPYCYRCPIGMKPISCNIECAKPLEKVLKENNQEICGFILEPLVQAAGGMIIYPKEYLKKARELTKKYNVHLILDEVATGFGRTGKMFACEYANIQPDFMCLSKGLTSGTLPLAATLTSSKIYNAFYADYTKKKTLYHGHTFTGNPISCSAALASLKIFQQEQTLDKLKKLIPIFHSGLEKFRGLALVGDVRYIGMIGAIELVKNKKKKLPFGFKQRLGLEIYKQGLKEGIILRPLGNIIYFYLPLCIKKTEILTVLGKAFKIIKKIKYGNRI